jgi:hypothetical protein
MESIASLLNKCKVLEKNKEIVKSGIPVESRFLDLKEA